MLGLLDSRYGLQQDRHGSCLHSARKLIINKQTNFKISGIVINSMRKITQGDEKEDNKR